MCVCVIVCMSVQPCRLRVCVLLPTVGNRILAFFSSSFSSSFVLLAELHIRSVLHQLSVLLFLPSNA